MKKSLYITTPIYYVNDKPHIGHAYTTILADVLARFNRAQGIDTFFLTGLDEHGQKVQEAASVLEISAKEHCDNMVLPFKSLWETLNISYDDFIRTTEQRHIKTVKNVLKAVKDRGDIYEAEYEGLYSVSEERFITEKEAATGHYRDIKHLKEKNYFFRMSNYQEQLIKHIETNPNFIKPIQRKNEILGFLKTPLNDLCISRPKSRLNWGIELPFDDKYVTYVWFDALINYITAAGYKIDDGEFNKKWPAYHLIGKDILTTHCVYWPTMLMSLGIELPKTIFAHGWWLMDDSKMSKSIGNIISPIELIDDYGIDPVRYYLMREMVLGQDASFTLDSFNKRYNSDLANDFGNLLSRVTTLIIKNYEGKIPSPGVLKEDELNLKEDSQLLCTGVFKKIEKMELNEAIEDIMNFIRNVNKYMEKNAPWKMVKEDRTNAGTVLHTAAESLRIAAVLLSPIMPYYTKKLLKIIGGRGDSLDWGGLITGYEIKKHEPLFPRIKF